MPGPTDASASLFEKGRNCWRIETAFRARMIVDAADYFRFAREAMLRARKQILLIGWDLDTRIQLVDEDPGDGAPIHLGRLISWLGRHRPELDIYILPWIGELFSFMGRGTTLARLGSWRLLRSNIHFRFDSTHPHHACHHHKILVIDDSFACCGGIDMTASRWDTSEHRDEEPGRRRPTTGRSYGPWHDAAMAVEGPVARALGDLGRERWEASSGERLEPSPSGSFPWPEGLQADFRDLPVAISRTRGHADPVQEVREIEALFVDMIMAARRFVYVESQYFASRVVAKAIARRLESPDPPEFVIVNPKSAEGFLEEAVMGAARAELFEQLRKTDREDRFRIYFPVTQRRQGIYVHAKIMVVDDQLLRVGSANLNNRSMGLDSECDLSIDARLTNASSVGDTIATLRCRLMAEHLGVPELEVARTFDRTGSLIATVEALRHSGRSLVPFQPPDFGELARTAAQSEVADPESADADIEPMARQRLLRGPRRRRRPVP